MTTEHTNQSAFWEIYRHGYRAASLERILAGTAVTKGALYHHFASKHRLGQAVIDEVIRPWMLDRWVAPLEGAADPIAVLERAVRSSFEDVPADMAHGGCPLFNLIHDVAGTDETLRQPLERVLLEWTTGLARGLARGQVTGFVRRDLDPETTAAFVVAAYEGIAGMTRARRDAGAADRLVRTYVTLIATLRSPGR